MLLSQSHDSIVFDSTRYCMCVLPNSACFLVLDTCQQLHMWLDKQRQLHSTWADAAGHSAAILQRQSPCYTYQICCCMQTLPAGACFLAMVLGLFIIEVIGSPSSLSPLNLTAQELVIILAALGSGSCVLMTMLIPHMTRRMTSRKPTLKGLRRMNFLGLVRWLSDADVAVIC